MGIVGDRIGMVDLNVNEFDGLMFFLPFTPTHLISFICSDFCSQFLISKPEILGVENWCTSLYFFLFLLAFLLLALLVAAIFGKCRLECFKGRLRKLVTWEFACSMVENSPEKTGICPLEVKHCIFSIHRKIMNLTT